MAQLAVNIQTQSYPSPTSNTLQGINSNVSATAQIYLEERLPVLIIGSAIAGTVFGLQLLSHPSLCAKYRPIIFDSAQNLPGFESFNDTLGSETTGQSGAAIALTRQAMYPLRKLKLGPELEEISQNTEQLTLFRQPFWGPQEGSQKGVSIMTTNAPPDVGVVGGMWCIERGKLQGLLIRKYLERGGEIILDKRLVKIKESTSTGSLPPNPIEAVFSDNTTYRGSLLVGADGAWSTVRKHLFTSQDASGIERIDEAWKPAFQNIQIVHGISHASTSDTKAAIYSLGLRNAGCATWTLKGDNRQYWTIYEAPVKPPASQTSNEADEALSKNWNMQVHCGGYDQASTETIVDRYKNVWHPSAGTFGNLFDNTEKFIRVGLWQKLFTRLSNVSWGTGEKLPKDCSGDRGPDSGRGNIVLAGDATRVLLPTAGQGAAFAIEDATVLANCMLNHPPTTTGGGIPDFSDALKQYTRQRLPRYRKISVIASAAARMSVGRTWVERMVRDYMSGLFGAPTSSVDEDDKREGKKGKGWWWEDWTSDRWLVGEKFEVKEEGVEKRK